MGRRPKNVEPVCKQCGGAGTVAIPNRWGVSLQYSETTCSACEGLGQLLHGQDDWL